jgi:zinc transport system ATP-binding protein
MDNKCIEFEHINFAYPHNQVLEDISFVVQEGDYVGLVGGNGSGKTTLLRILLGLATPESGAVFLFGRDIREFRAWHSIGYVPQHVARGEDSFSTTVREVIECGLVSKKKRFFFKDLSDEEHIRRAMNVAEIADLEHRLIGTLSGGERQLAFIARALVSRPKLLVLDEPTTGVDAQSQDRFYRFLSALNGEHAMTIILVSHDLEVVSREVKTVMCVNRKLVCHMESQTFIDGDYLKRLYGEEMKYVPHMHHH